MNLEPQIVNQDLISLTSNPETALPVISTPVFFPKSYTANQNFLFNLEYDTPKTALVVIINPVVSP